MAASGTCAGRPRRQSGRSGPGDLAAARFTPREGAAAGAPVIEIQRSRLIAGAVRAVEELGYTGTTVAQITRRARVSRRTFYELFSNREECLAAVLEHALRLVESELYAAELDGLAWRERVRMGLWAILSFLDREPALARVCVVQAPRGGALVLERRDEILARLAAVVDEGRLEGPRAASCTAMTAEGLVGATFAIVYARLSRGQQGSLRDLLGELVSMIVLPYQGAAAARREQTRPAPAPAPVADVEHEPLKAPRLEKDPLDGVAMRLTYRTVRVLEGIAGYPGLSNREISEYAGIADQGQVSKLLTRLERLGLLVNQGEGHQKGEPNAWKLTSKGELVAENISMHLPNRREAA